jgi:ABC-type multidrug transport system fused ATPase/permease subunit
MNHLDVMNWVAGAIQFVVAAYALRLNRLFGTARVGWSLFCAFALLALLHLVESVTTFNGGPQTATIINAMYALISFLLLTGMVHMETLLKERMRMEAVEHQLRVELETRVQQKTAHLTRSIEELVREIDERKRIEAQYEKEHKELLEASRKAAQLSRQERNPT